MNREQVAGLIRNLLSFVGGFIIAKQWLPAAMVNEIIGALVIIGVAAWEFWAGTLTSQVASVKAKAEVENVVTTADRAGKELARSIPGPEVVSSADVTVVPK